jgi:hypothetical protein
MAATSVCERLEPLPELETSGDFTGLAAEERASPARHNIETLIGLDEATQSRKRRLEETNGVSG